MAIDEAKLRATNTPPGLPFKVQKIGHIVFYVSDLDRSVRFYTEILGFKVSDVYPESMVSGGMVFLRCSADHHGVALVGGAGGPSQRRETHHTAFELATLDEVFRARDHLEKHEVPIVYQGRRRAGCQIAVEFLDPDGHHLELYWGLDQVGTDGYVRPPEEWRHTKTLEEAVDNPPPGQGATLHDASLRR